MGGVMIAFASSAEYAEWRLETSGLGGYGDGGEDGEGYGCGDGESYGDTEEDDEAVGWGFGVEVR